MSVHTTHLIGGMPLDEFVAAEHHDAHDPEQTAEALWNAKITVEQATVAMKGINDDWWTDDTTYALEWAWTHDRSPLSDF